MVKTISRIQKCHFDLVFDKTIVQHIFEGIFSNIPCICFIQPWVNQSIQVLTIISCCSEHFRQNLGEHISDGELSMNLSNTANLQTACEKSSLNGKISDSFHARYLVTSSQQQSQQHLLSVFWLQHTFSLTSITLHLQWLYTELLLVPASCDKFQMSMRKMKCMIRFSPSCEPREELVISLFRLTPQEHLMFYFGLITLAIM